MSMLSFLHCPINTMYEAHNPNYGECMSIPSISLLSAIFLSACVTGNNYPDQYAKTFCETTFQCLDNQDIATFTGYDTIEECILDISTNAKDSDTYKDWQAGNMVFNKDNAELCLNELVQVQEKSTCDGSMNVLTYAGDIQNDACADVYQTP